jgi:hypothetical protein
MYLSEFPLEANYLIPTSTLYLLLVSFAPFAYLRVLRVSRFFWAE